MDWRKFNSEDLLFKEAVALKHKLGIRTTDPDPRFRDVIVQPFYVASHTYRLKPPIARLEPPKMALWCHVPQPNQAEGHPRAWATNHEIYLDEITEWKILAEVDLTSRAIARKRYEEFKDHPGREALLACDRRLREVWAQAAAKPDFDPAPFVAADDRLARIAADMLAWLEGLPGGRA